MLKAEKFIYASLEHLIEQAVGFLFHGDYVGADFVEHAHRLPSVEVAGPRPCGRRPSGATR